MKKQLLISMLFVIVALTSCSKDGDPISEGMSDGSTRSGGIYIPDANFRNFLLNNPQIDTNGDRQISIAEAKAVASMDCGGRNIASLEGIEYFTNLTWLACDANILTCLHLSVNTKLKDLYCHNNQLSSIDISKNTVLEFLYCYNNNLSSLDVSYTSSHLTLNCYNMPSLDTLYVNVGQVIPNVTENRSDEKIPANTTIVRVNRNIHIPDANFKAYLLGRTEPAGGAPYDNIIDTNNDGEISYAEATKVTFIFCSSKNISSLEGIEYFTNLYLLDCSQNQLTSLDVSKNLGLSFLYCSQNQLTSLDVSKNLRLSSLSCSQNQLTSLDVSKNMRLNSLDCSPMSTLNTLTLLVGQVIPNVTVNRNANNIPANTAIVRVDRNIHFSDANFKAYLVDRPANTNGAPFGGKIDTNNDGEISEAEALEVIYIDCKSLNIRSLVGIEYFTNLEYLTCSNNQLTSLDVSENTELGAFSCVNNQLRSIDISKNLSLAYFSCDNNQLTSINVSKNLNIFRISCFSNQLTSLDVSKNARLDQLSCSPMSTLNTLTLKYGQTIRSLSKPSHTTISRVN